MFRKIYLMLLCVGLAMGSTRAQSLYFPPVSGSTWDTLSPSTLGWCQPSIDSLYDYLEFQDSKAFILLKGGKIVLEKYFGTFTQDSLWYWASAGKTLTAFTVGIAQQENYLSIIDTTSDYLGAGWTDCTPQQEEKITIWHQLTMTSGLDDGVPDHYCTLDTCLQYLADAGTRWAYHNGPYTLLDGVIANATGQSLNAYFASRVRNPIGMNGLFVPSGYNNLYVSNARSMARFGLLIQGRGNWNGNQIMTDTAYFNQMVNTSQNLNPSYGYLWWLNGKSSFMVPGLQFVFPGSFCTNAPADMFAALGKNGQIISIAPSQDLLWIRMGNAPFGGGDVSFTLADSVWLRINHLNCATSTNTPLSGNLLVYPVPSAGNMDLRMEDGQSILGLEIYDVLGRIIQSEAHLEGSSARVTGLKPGTYWLRASTENGIWVKQVLVQ